MNELARQRLRVPDFHARRGTRICAGALVSSLLLSACAPDRPYLSPRFDFRPSYVAAPRGAPVLLANTEWWHRLDDPVLDALVTLALSGNPTLQAARARIDAARAARDGVPGAALLSSSASAGVGGSDTFGSDRRADLQAGFNWLLDPYGSRRDQLRIAAADIESAAAERDAAQLLLLLQLGQSYVELRYRQQLLILSQQELRTRQRTLRVVRQLSSAGEAIDSEITRSEARVAELTSRLPGDTAAVAATLSQLAVLAGASPGALPGNLQARLAQPAAQPRPGLSPEVGIPADLLRNRPDIVIAERGYYAALARIGIARAALYPRLSLTGTISLDAASRDSQYFFGPQIQFPSLPAGSGRAQVAQRRAEAAAAHAAWKSTVLGALLEVERALLDYRAATASTAAAARAAQLYRQALSQTREVFDRGEATLTDLIAAEEEVAAADRSLAEFRYRQAVGFVTLSVRLGSGSAAATGDGSK